MKIESFPLVMSKSSKSKLLKENDPRYCRCGEAREGEKITPRDIQDWDLTTTTTTTTTTQSGSMLGGNLDAILDNERLAIGALDSVDKMKKYYRIDDQKDLKKRYAPFIPQMRPWLAIVEVNMTNTTMNTECTGGAGKEGFVREFVVQARSSPPGGSSPAGHVSVPTATAVIWPWWRRGTPRYTSSRASNTSSGLSTPSTVHIVL